MSSKLCRICMSDSAEVSIFQIMDNQRHQISKLINTITKIEITENDGLPSEICNKCLAELQIVMRFKQKCEETDYILRKKINMTKAESIKNESDVGDQDTLLIKEENCNDDNSQHSDSSVPVNYVECIMEHNNSDTETSSIDVFDKCKSATDMDSNSETPISKKVIQRLKCPETDENDTEHQCEMCEMSFSTTLLLRKHHRKHSAPIYQCEVCKKMFKQNSHLQRHLLIHTGLRPFACDVCKKTFKEKAHLTRHMTIHNGNKPYQCEVCGKNFLTTSDLNKHLIIHTGQRPFQCEICGNGYNNKSDLNKHLIRKHDYDKNRFRCGVCMLQFNTGKNLNQHMLVHCESDTIWSKVR